ncbi:MAG: mannitol-1-phosphate 5-dehydrogenase [Spirochaetaceae bacterium]|nr:MAG: mannitol-1-phosphate 5-dehydrogenase [Spirochaetaceae bacterium]
MNLLQFGAGNIGRSFIGQLFSRAGWTVTFVDVDQHIVAAINRRRAYPVVVKHPDGREETIEVKGVDAIDGRDREAVVAAVHNADLVATAVGTQALPSVVELIAEGLKRRQNSVSIIIAENIRNGAAVVRDELRKHLPPDSAVLSRTGLVESSIGKMVPLMTEADRQSDPLRVFAEPYNTLILDRLGFRGPVPAVAGIKAVDNITAYVDRKLFVHNMGHAACAYLGYREDPQLTYIWQAVELDAVHQTARAAMQQSAAALVRAYPNDLDAAVLTEHIDDLLTRFSNRSLGDTIYRVGRDLPRKLHKGDRLIGAMLLAQRMECPYDQIIEAARAALAFRAVDESGQLYPNDRLFLENDLPRGTRHVLGSVSELDPDDAIEHQVFSRLLASFDS